MNLKQLERQLLSRVNQQVEDAYADRNKDKVAGMVEEVLASQPDFPVSKIRVELVERGYARLTGVFPIMVQNGWELERDEAAIVIEGLYDYSPHTCAFRFDILHMRAKVQGDKDGVQGEAIVKEILATWRQLPAFGDFRYRPGVFVIRLRSEPGA